jgi:putative oxidoreductase
MSALDRLARVHAQIATGLDRLQAPALLAMRLHVSWQFLKSGWLKLTEWNTTIYLFTDEYRVPLLPPTVAAVAGTAGELVFPALLVLGLFSRIGALGLFAVNALAVIAYRHVLLADGYEAALAQHVLWGVMLGVLAVVGPGRWAIDHWLERRPPQAAIGSGAGFAITKP